MFSAGAKIRDDIAGACEARPRLFGPIFLDVAVHLRQHELAGVIGPVFPSEDAGRHGPVKTDLRQSAEEIVPRNLSLANIQVLMHTSLRSGWVQDVAQAGACLVIERACVR